MARLSEKEDRMPNIADRQMYDLPLCDIKLKNIFLGRAFIIPIGDRRDPGYSRKCM